MVFEPNWSRLRSRPKTQPTPAREPEAAPKTSQAIPEVAARAERARLQKQVQGLRDRGLTHQQIATALQVRNVQRPNGAPWTDKAVSGILQSIKRKMQANSEGAQDPQE